MSSHVVEKQRSGLSDFWSRFFGSSRAARDNIAAYLFLFPFLIVYITFIIYPVIQAAYMSFFDWDLLAPLWFGIKKIHWSKKLHSYAMGNQSKLECSVFIWVAFGGFGNNTDNVVVCYSQIIKKTDHDLA